MKRNTTSPSAQPSLFPTEGATRTLPPPKPPRSRPAVSATKGEAPVKTNTKIAKTNSTPKPAAPVPPAPAQSVTPPQAALSAKPTPPARATATSKTSSKATATVNPDTKAAKLTPIPKPCAKAAPVQIAVAAKASTPVKTPPGKTAVGSAKQKIAKTNSLTKKTAPSATAVRVVNEPVFEGGMLWKMSGKNGVAYIKDAALAGELLAIDPKKLAQAAMAVYYDKKGKPFAWQVRFDTDRWDEVMRRLG